MAKIAAQMDAATRQLQAADRRHAKEMAALFRKSMVGKSLGRKGASVKIRRAAGATRGAGSWRTLGNSPIMLFKQHKGGIRGDRYAEKSGDGGLLCTNMLGQTAAERRAEFELDSQRRPGVNPKHLYVHLSFSLAEGRQLDRQKWTEAIWLFLAEIGADGVQFAANLHRNTQHQHAHLTYSRVKPDGSLVGDGNSYWRWRAATRRVEQHLGLKQNSPSETEVQTTSDRQLNASKRAMRKNDRNPFINPQEIRDVLAQAQDFEHFKNSLSIVGISTKKAEKNGRTTGLLFKLEEAQTWLAGSTIDRALSLPSIERQLAKNAADHRAQQRARQEFSRHQQAQIIPHQRPQGPRP